MIDELNVAKSCLAKLKEYADAESIDIAIQGKTFEPVADAIYLEEFLISNTNQQGVSNLSSEIQRPIYQINIHTPKVMGKWKGLSIYTDLKTTFARASDISLDANQQVKVEMVDKTNLQSSDTHNIMAVSVNLSLIG